VQSSHAGGAHEVWKWSLKKKGEAPAAFWDLKHVSLSSCVVDLNLLLLLLLLAVSSQLHRRISR